MVKPLVSFVLGIFAIFAFSVSAQTWEKFAKGDEFSVDMPGTPSEQKQVLDTAAGKIDLYLYGVEASPTLAYMIAHSDYPESLVNAQQPDTMLDNARDGQINQVNGTLVSEKKTTISGYPGRETHISIPGGMVMKGRLYMVKTRLFQLIVVCGQDVVNSPDIAKFLGSFKLGMKYVKSSSGTMTPTEPKLPKIEIDTETEPKFPKIEPIQTEKFNVPGKETWVAFNDKAGKFKVLLPAQPKKQSQQIPTAIGPVMLHMFMHEASHDMAYMVGYSDYPAQLVKASDPVKMLDGGRDGAARNVNGKVSDEKHIKIDGFPGRAFTITNPQGMIMKSRIFMVNNRLYQVVAVVMKGKKADADIKKFHESFSLTK